MGKSLYIIFIYLFIVKVVRANQYDVLFKVVIDGLIKPDIIGDSLFLYSINKTYEIILLLANIKLIKRFIIQQFILNRQNV